MGVIESDAKPEQGVMGSVGEKKRCQHGKVKTWTKRLCGCLFIN